MTVEIDFDAMYTVIAETAAQYHAAFVLAAGSGRLLIDAVELSGGAMQLRFSAVRKETAA